MSATDTQRTIDAVWRIESPRLIAGLARIVRDVGLAEELAQDALVTALERWPETGVPENPGAWLMAAAKNRAIDQLRRKRRLERKHEELGREIENEQERERARSRGGARRRRGRRPLAPGVHGLPSRAFHRSAGRAHAAGPGRPDYGGNRPRFLGSRSRRLPSGSFAPNEPWPSNGFPSKFPGAPSSARACRRCSKSST